MIRRIADLIPIKPSVLLAIVAFSVAGCTRTPQPADVGVATAETCPEGDEALYPEGIVPDAHFPLRRSMSDFLTRMGEPSLWCGPHEADEEYRLILDETWTDPRAIRVSRTGGEFALNVVVLEGPGGFVRGAVKGRYSRRLTAAEWREITTAIDELGFWRMTTTVDNLLGNDGTVWTIEARRAGRYHYVGRWVGADGVEGAGQAFVALDTRD